MSLQIILDAIHANGATQLRELEVHANAQVREILANAHAEALKLKEEACAKASAPAGRERARILHRAHLESLHILGNMRDELIKTALDRTRGRLANARAEESYPMILRRLVEESLAELDCAPDEKSQVHLEADPRDQSLLNKILSDMGLTLPVDCTLRCWGGLVARSVDGQIVVINTLEARLERAMPYLRRYLAAASEIDTSQPERDSRTGEEHFARI